MPWCEECAKYRTPNSVNEDGSCPTCGTTLHLPDTAEGTEIDRTDEKSPWHFKLMVGMVVLYLGWRVIQLFA